VPSIPPSSAILGSNAWTSRASRRQRARRHVRHDSRQQVDAVAKLSRQWIVEMAFEHLDAIAPGTFHGVRVELGREHPRCRHGGGEHGSDRARARAEIDGHAPGGQECRRPAGQVLGLGSRHVDARGDGQLEAAEADRTRQPCDRLAAGPTRDQIIEHDRVTAGGPDQLTGLLFGGDAARLGEHLRHRGMIQLHGFSLSGRCAAHPTDPSGLRDRRVREPPAGG